MQINRENLTFTAQRDRQAEWSSVWVKQDKTLTCQMSFSLSADNPLLGVLQEACKKQKNKIRNTHVKVGQSNRKQRWGSGVSGNGVGYLTLVVNCTPVLMIRGFCGCVGMHGCFSTTNELKTNHTSNALHIFFSAWSYHFTASVFSRANWVTILVVDIVYLTPLLWCDVFVVQRVEEEVARTFVSLPYHYM